MAPHIAIRRFETNGQEHDCRHLLCEKQSFKLCLGCRERTALYRTWRRPDRVAWDPTHRLCFACYRSLRDSLRQPSDRMVSLNGPPVLSGGRSTLGVIPR
jgi:hypothetical protein